MAQRRNPSLKHFPLTAVRAALAKSMAREHSRRVKHLADLEGRMREAGVPVPNRRAGPPSAIRNGLGNTMSLHAALERVMRGKVMTPEEATSAVERPGRCPSVPAPLRSQAPIGSAMKCERSSPTWCCWTSRW